MRILLLFLFITANFYSVFSQEDNAKRYINARTQGSWVSFGFTYYDLPEGVTYRPILLQSYFHNPLYQTKNKFNVAVDVLPQSNVAFLDSKPEIEFGINVFFDFSFELSEKSLLSFNIGSGPHFISVKTTKQINGYIFSDNFILAYKRKISEDLEFNIHSGYRHMSNASIRRPNNGIDNILVGVGFSKFILK